MSQEADYEEFLALRRHVRKLQAVVCRIRVLSLSCYAPQAGTPLLLRTQGAQGQDLDLQICSFQISQDRRIFGSVHK